MAIVKRKPVTSLDEAQIQRMFRANMGNNFKVMIPNFFAQGNFGFEADLMCIRRSGYAVEVEVKISESDFRADFKKCTSDNKAEPIREFVSEGYYSFKYPTIKKHELLVAGRLVSNYLCYAMPLELAQKLLPEIPNYAGLYAFSETGNMTTLKQPTLLHKQKIGESRIAAMAENLCHRYWTAMEELKAARTEENRLYRELMALRGQPQGASLEQANLLTD